MRGIRSWSRVLVAASIAALVCSAAGAAMVSKEYVYEAGKELTVDADASDGEVAFRLRTIRFLYPDEALVRFSDAARAEVSVTNLGKEPLRIGIAIALYDAEGALVGVASGGSKWVAIKPGKRSFYTVKFTDVDRRLREATSFRITVESR